jgi:hypothetical protein
LAAWRAEVNVRTAHVLKFRDSSLTEFLLMPVEISSSELNPSTSKCMLVVDGVSGELRGSELGELGAKPTSIAERDNDNWIGKSKVSFAHVTTKYISEK